MKYAIYFLLSLLLVFAGCGGRTQMNKLNTIDSLAIIEEYDSAYAMFSSIDPNSISDDEEQAFYGILQMQLYARYDIILENDSLADACISYYEQKHDGNRLARAYYYKGVNAFMRGDTVAALTHIKQAEEVEAKAYTPWLRYLILGNLAFIHNCMGAHKTAFAYSKKALEQLNNSKTDNAEWICYVYDLIAQCHLYLGNKDSVFAYYAKAIPYIEKIKYKLDRAAYYTNTGYALYLTGEYEKAEPLARKALELYPMPTMRINLAKVCHALHKDEETDTLLKAAWKDAGYDEKAEILEFLGKTTEEKQLYKESADYYRRARAMQDSAHMAQNTEVLMAAQKDIDRKKFEHKIDEHNRLTLWVTALVVAVLGAISYAYSRSRLNKARKIIMDSRRMIERYTAELEQLKAGGEDNRARIIMLETKIRERMERQTAILERGRKLCENIRGGGTTAGWSSADYEAAVEYLRANSRGTVEAIERSHSRLTAYNTFFLLLPSLGVENSDVARVMNVSQGAVRTMRHRLRNKEKAIHSTKQTSNRPTA